MTKLEPTEGFDTEEDEATTARIIIAEDKALRELGLPGIPSSDEWEEAIK